MPELSVVVPVYNMEPYLEKCLVSIMNQDYHNMEIIIVNDGSTDRSRAIISEIMDRFPDRIIHVIDKENAGLPQARRTGLEHAKGEYISFIDSDDWIDPGYFKNSMRYVAESGLEIYNLGYIDDHGENKECVKAKYGEYKEVSVTEYVSLLHKSVLFHTMWSKIFKRTFLLDSISFPYGNFIYEDYVTLIPGLRQVNTIGLIPEGGYHYRYREDSMGNCAFSESKRLGYSNISNLYPEVIKWYPECKEYIDVFYAIQYMSFLMSMGRSGEYDKSIVMKIKSFIRNKIFSVLKPDYVELRFKLSIIPLSIAPKFFSKMYAMTFYH